MMFVEPVDHLQVLFQIPDDDPRNLPRLNRIRMLRIPARRVGPRHHDRRFPRQLLELGNRTDKPTHKVRMLGAQILRVVLRRFLHRELAGREEPRVVDQSTHQRLHAGHQVVLSIGHTQP